MINKSRQQVAAFLEKQFAYEYKCSLEKGSHWHYGKQNLRELMDFLFDGPPNDAEVVFVKRLRNKRASKGM